jgi:hypothetical protein
LKISDIEMYFVDPLALVGNHIFMGNVLGEKTNLPKLVPDVKAHIEILREKIKPRLDFHRLRIPGLSSV